MPAGVGREKKDDLLPGIPFFASAKPPGPALNAERRPGAGGSPG
jgi:hypothetical protein